MEWFRRLVAKKFDGSKKRDGQGRPPIDKEIETLVLKFARENPSWGYDRIAGALQNLGHDISDQTVGNILKHHGSPKAPKRKAHLPWSVFLRRHHKAIAACDFFTTEVLTAGGLITYYVLFFIHLQSRRVFIAGATPNPKEDWMKNIAREVTMETWGFLKKWKCNYLILDGDKKFCPSFMAMLKWAGINVKKIPPNSPQLNGVAERWVRTVKEECLSNLIFFGVESLYQALYEFKIHYHEERNHQGKGNLILFPRENDAVMKNKSLPIVCHQRLGGLLKFYYRKAA